ncbi:MAG: phosphopantetheine--protein transferase domain [Mycobacterium sp.]|nr:phosphopantetheine--protein transferase domain [Mycobacterium sp.]MCW2745771.1 phosphopantetheine--protein transferase domain [Mycobacterium sp.]
MIVGVGVDVVDVARFARSLDRTPALAARLFTAAERAVTAPERLAARFAAKEAVAKVLGAPAGLAWHDCEVRTGERGAPTLALAGTVAAAAAAAGVVRWHVSLSHDGGIATAVVIGEGEGA